MHILITGGSGFIGHALCEQRVKAGDRVTVLSRDPVKARSRLPGAVTLISDLQALEGMVPVDAIVNLAGEPLADRRWSEARKQRFYDSRIGVTERLFEYFSDHEQAPAVLVSASAVGFYGPQGDEILEEDSDVCPSFSHSLCDQWESAAEQFEQLGTRVCRLRFGVVLGPDGGALSAMLPMFKLGLGGPMGSGRQWMSWIHRNDLIALISFCLDRDDIAGPVNATAPHPVTNREFARHLGRALGRPAVLRVPEFALRLMFGQMADELLLGGQRVCPRVALEAGFHYAWPHLDQALADVVGA